MRYKIEDVKRELRCAYSSLNREANMKIHMHPQEAVQFSRAAVDVCEAIDAVERRDFYKAMRLLECICCPGYINRSIIFKLRELIADEHRPTDIVRHTSSSTSGSTDPFIIAVSSIALSVGISALASLICDDEDSTKK